MHERHLLLEYAEIFIKERECKLGIDFNLHVKPYPRPRAERKEVGVNGHDIQNQAQQDPEMEEHNTKQKVKDTEKQITAQVRKYAAHDLLNYNCNIKEDKKPGTNRHSTSFDKDTRQRRFYKKMVQ